jgi:hypothetical protein
MVSWLKWTLASKQKLRTVKCESKRGRLNPPSLAAGDEIGERTDFYVTCSNEERPPPLKG